MLQLFVYLLQSLSRRFSSHSAYLFLSFVVQNGVTSSIKPQQITYIVPGVQNFDTAEISDFIEKAQDNLVCSSCIL